MKREIKMGTMGGHTIEATIIINKDGLVLENVKPDYTDINSIISRYLSRCIDMDGWKHSWHTDTSNAILKNSSERKNVRSILKEKIEKRESEIKELKDAIQILGRWHY